MGRFSSCDQRLIGLSLLLLMFDLLGQPLVDALFLDREPCFARLRVVHLLDDAAPTCFAVRSTLAGLTIPLDVTALLAILIIMVIAFQVRHVDAQSAYCHWSYGAGRWPLLRRRRVETCALLASSLSNGAWESANARQCLWLPAVWLWLARGGPDS